MSIPTTHLHAEIIFFSEGLLTSPRYVAKFSAATALEHQLHEGLHNLLCTRKSRHTTFSFILYSSASYDSSSPVKKIKELMTIRVIFVVKFLLAPRITLLKEAPSSINSDEADLYWSDRLQVPRLRCGHHLTLHWYENCLHPDINSVGRWYGHSGDFFPFSRNVCNWI